MAAFVSAAPTRLVRLSSSRPSLVCGGRGGGCGATSYAPTVVAPGEWCARRGPSPGLPCLSDSERRAPAVLVERQSPSMGAIDGYDAGDDKEEVFATPSKPSFAASGRAITAPRPVILDGSDDTFGLSPMEVLRTVRSAASAEDIPTGGPNAGTDWLFSDVAKINVTAGDGGNGVMAFRREKGVPKGGPFGGSGGAGGHVYLVADRGLNTLARFRGRVHFRAEDGNNGLGKGKNGAGGRDTTVSVPVGTVVRDAKSRRVVADLSYHGSTVRVARGGRGGRGNMAFKTDRNRAPRMCERGEPGISRWLKLELKLVADAGLVGVPNAGKSTLLSRVSAARPKIADYPFTTVVPQLGVVDGYEGEDGDAAGGSSTPRSMVLVDIPGLLEGAHSGVGMGTAFLRHIERCRAIVHVVDGSAADPVGDYQAICSELELFNPRLAKKPSVVLLNKLDLPHARHAWEEGGLRDAMLAAMPHRRLAAVSAVSGEGLRKVLHRLTDLVLDARAKDDGGVVIAPSEYEEDEEESLMARKVTVTRVAQGVYDVRSPKIDRAVAMTNWDYVEAVDRFQRILEAVGANRALKAAGAVDGDAIVVGDREFVYYERDNIYSAAAFADGYTDGFKDEGEPGHEVAFDLGGQPCDGDEGQDEYEDDEDYSTAVAEANAGADDRATSDSKRGAVGGRA